MDIKFGLKVGDWKTAVWAEKTGFDSVWKGDHLLPWGPSLKRKGTSALVVLPLLAEKTRRITVGTEVICPLFRYHPERSLRSQFSPY